MKTAAFLACAALAGAAAADVTNGDFSSGLTGWTWTADAGSEPSMLATTAAGPFGTGPAFRVNAGSETAGNERGGTLSQSVALTGGVNYSVAAMLAIQNVSGSPNADGGTITVTLGGSLIDTFDVGQIAANTLLTHPVSGNFTPGSTGNYAMELRFTRSFPNFVSNILHWADSVSVVPAPSSAALLGVGGLLIARRRR